MVSVDLKPDLEIACETLAEYYCRINGHLLGRIEVFEVDDAGNTRIIKGKAAEILPKNAEQSAKNS